jgi:hypothetical protein
MLATDELDDAELLLDDAALRIAAEEVDDDADDDLRASLVLFTCSAFGLKSFANRLR